MLNKSENNFMLFNKPSCNFAKNRLHANKMVGIMTRFWFCRHENKCNLPDPFFRNFELDILEFSLWQLVCQNDILFQPSKINLLLRSMATNGEYDTCALWYQRFSVDIEVFGRIMLEFCSSYCSHIFRFNDMPIDDLYSAVLIYLFCNSILLT
jgi:hypothetical protein